jgi:hypothetical protein
MQFVASNLVPYKDISLKCHVEIGAYNIAGYWDRHIPTSNLIPGIMAVNVVRT